MPYSIHAHKRKAECVGHVPAMIAGLGQMFRTPVVSFFLVFIITFALFLSAGFYVLQKNVKVLDDVWSQSAEISLYLKKGLNQQAVADLMDRLKLNDAIGVLELISPDEGMESFAASTGFGEILLGVKDNPLPNVVIIRPKLSQLSESRVLGLVDNLKDLPEAETVKVDMRWVERSYQLLSLLERLSMILAILLNMGAAVLICCASYVTPQLIKNRIDTSDTSGRIIQYQCFWHSVIGGLLAIALVNFILMVLHNAGFILQGLGVGASTVFILLGVILNVASLRVTIRKS
jgi:cell division transport system permease protein